MKSSIFGYMIDLVMLIKIFSVVFLLLIVHIGSQYIFKKLEKKFKDQHWKHSFIEALHTPFALFLGLIGLVIIGHFIVSTMAPEKSQFIFFQAYFLTTLFCGTWFFLRWTKRVKTHYITYSNDRARVDILSKLVYLVIWIIAIIFTLEVLGFNIATLVTIGGIGGISLGFAGKDVFSNFFGGLMIYLTRPFVIDDYIKTTEKNIEGTVEEISWYYTLIRDKDKQANYVPNSIFSTVVVTNLTRRSHWAFDETISLRHEDVKILPRIIEEIKKIFIENSEFDHNQPIRIYLNHVGDASLQLSILAYTFTSDSDKTALIKQDCLAKIAHVVDKYEGRLAPTSIVATY